MVGTRRCGVLYFGGASQQHTDFRLHRSGTHWAFDKWAIDEASPVGEGEYSGWRLRRLITVRLRWMMGGVVPGVLSGGRTVSYDSTVYTAQKVNEVVTAQDANHAVHMELKPAIMRCVGEGAGAGSFEEVYAAEHSLSEWVPFEYAFTGRGF